MLTLPVALDAARTGPLWYRGERPALFVLFFSLYALIGRGTFYSSDEGGGFNTALSVLRTRSLVIAPGENIHRGRGGNYYASREILPSLCSIPPCLLGMLLDSSGASRELPLAPLPPLERHNGTNWPIFLTVTMLGPGAVACTLLLLGTFVREEGGSRRCAYWLMSVAGWATPLTFYAKTIFPQVFEGALLMALLLNFRRWRRGGKARDALAMGIACALGMMTRANFALVGVLAAVCLLLAGEHEGPTRRRALLRLLPPMVLGAAATGCVNWLRWESPVDFGYRHSYETFSTPPLSGLWGLLASPGKGLLIVAPVMLLPVCFGRVLWRAGRAEVLLLLGVTAAYLALYCRWYDWPGGIAWGPRFLVPLIAPWLALLGRAFAAPRAVWVWRLSVAAFLMGFVLQWVAITVHPKWMGWKQAETMSWSHAEPIVLAGVLRDFGADDLWLWSRSPASGWVRVSFGLTLFGCVFCSGAFLCFRSRLPSERLAMLGPSAVSVLILLGGVLVGFF